MRGEIFQGMGRLELHDSHIIGLVKDGDKLVLTIDWAKSTDYRELGIEEGIIIEKCELFFCGLSTENLILDFSGNIGHEDIRTKEIDFNPELFPDWLILENKLEDKNTFRLNGLIDYEETCGWLDWRFLFKDFKLTWNNFVTRDDWNKENLNDNE